jgi:hypothetical protein
MVIIPSKDGVMKGVNNKLRVDGLKRITIFKDSA